MSPLTTDPVFQAYCASAVVLGLNMLALATVTAGTRARANEAINPEDVALNRTARVVYDEGNELTARIRRAHRNALENVVLFLATGLLLPLVGAPLWAAAPLYAVFVAARLVHSLAYVSARQPWRTASYGVGVLAQVGVLVVVGFLAVQGLLAA